MPPVEETTMPRRFRPSFAVEADNARHRGQLEKFEVTSKAHLSKDWRLQVEKHASSFPRVQASMTFYPSSTTTTKDVLMRKTAGMSPYYRGDPTVVSNQSAAIPNSANTSLWVTGLPKEQATYYDLMDLLRGRGKILAANIAEAKPHHYTAAATITFFRHIDAENVMRAMNNGTLRALVDRAGMKASTGNIDNFDYSANSEARSAGLGTQRGEPTLIDLDIEQTFSTSMVISEVTSNNKMGLRLAARWNRVRVAEPKLRFVRAQQEDGSSRLPSRVIHVSGRMADVNPDSLEAYFSSKFRYNLDRIVYHGIQDDSHQYEYRFACWRNQAEFAAMAIRRERPDIKFWYGVDPCEVVEDVHLLDRADPEMEVVVPT